MSGARRPRLLWICLLGASALIVAAFGSLFYVETAAVRIVVPPQRIATSVQMTGGGASDVALQHLDARVLDTVRGTPTKSTPIAPRYAAGQVTFQLACPGRYPLVPCPPVTVPAGSVLSTPKGRRYTTDATVTLKPGKQRELAGVHAIVLGSAGNTAPGTITIIRNNPRGLPLQVFNYYAADGGVDARVAHIIQQSDIDTARESLAARVTDELRSAIAAKAAGLTYFVDGPPTLKFSVNRSAGTEVPAFFNATMTGRQSALAFSNDAAQAFLRTALQRLAAPGYELAAGPIQATYQLRPSANGAATSIWADAVGLAQPQISASTIRARVKGTTLADAANRLNHDFAGSAVDIRIEPLALPLLPILPEHINVTVVLSGMQP
jgi:hypothetical protein